MIPKTHFGLPAVFLSLLPLLAGCATTPGTPDPIAPAIATAKSFQQALADQDFDAVYALIADEFTSAAWPTREDLRVHLVEARDRGHFAPATISPEPLVGMVKGDRVRVYPVGLRSRAGVAVFDLTLAPRGAEWKIISATLEFY